MQTIIDAIVIARGSNVNFVDVVSIEDDTRIYNISAEIESYILLYTIMTVSIMHAGL